MKIFFLFLSIVNPTEGGGVATEKLEIRASSLEACEKQGDRMVTKLMEGWADDSRTAGFHGYASSSCAFFRIDG